MTGRHFLLEGVDLSGKSSAISGIRLKNHKLHYQHSSIVANNPILDVAKLIKKDGSEWIGHLYAEAVKWDIDHYQKPIGTVLQDSTTLLRSLAFHAAAGYASVVEKLEALVPSFPKFDKVYVLTASINARRARLIRRQSVDGARVTANDLKVINDPQFFKRMDDALIDYADTIFGAEVIDTSNMTPQEVIDAIEV